MADYREWKDIASTTRYPFMPSAPTEGSGTSFPEGLFADIQACCPGGRLFLTSYRRTSYSGIEGTFTGADEWTASFEAAYGDLAGGWGVITEDSTGNAIGTVVFCEQANELIDTIGMAPNVVNAEVIPTLLCEPPGGVTGFIAPDETIFRGDVIIETDPDDIPEGVFLETSGGVNAVIVVSAAGISDTSFCDKTALRSINGVEPDSRGELVLETSTGDLTGVLRILPGAGTITFRLETQ